MEIKMSIVERRYWANIKMNEKFINLKTHSGYRIFQYDYSGENIYLSPEVNNIDFGLEILSALGASRFVLPAPRNDVVVHPDVEYDAPLHNYILTEERYRKWVTETMEKFGYKTKRAMFKNMKNCDVVKSSENMKIKPWFHNKLEAWSLDGISEEDNVVIPADSSAEEIGVAARLALSRCI
ncbi:hypothetical protein AA105894_2160 [Asaia spathodeae NBRC 105894]|nr:hypothetical protein AA105894_2160 [Asaia spathodeae NBRC 105894]